MAQKLLTLDEAAARLGISSDELLHFLDQRKIFAIKDGGSWKFKSEEVDRFKADLEGSGSTSGEKAYYLPVDSDESQEDGGLVTDALLGGHGQGSSTIIGPGGEVTLGQDSDLTLGGGSDSGSDSDVKLVADVDLDSGGSGVKLVPNPGSGIGSGSGSGTGTGSGSDLQMLDLDTGSGAFKLQADPDATIEAKPGSGVKIGGSSGKLGGGSGSKTGSGIGKSAKPGSGIGKSGKTAGGSDLTLSESGLSLGEDDDLQIGGSSSAKGMNSSKLKLADEQFDDDDIVLGGSSSGSTGLGSGIGDSGINLAAAADSGLSLEEPLELSSEDARSDDSSGEQDLSSDDDFLLTPMLELDDQDSSDSSGSQVIALDTESAVDDQAATLLGHDPLVGAAMAATGSQAMGPGPVMMMPASPQGQHSGFTVSLLVLCFLVLSLSGMMIFEVVRDMSNWGGTSAVSTKIVDGLLSIFEK